MATFGICTAVERGGEVRSAGWDFVEENVQTFLQGQTPHDQWNGLARAARSPLPVLVANRLVPADLKITGPHANLDALGEYMETVLNRAASAGTRTLVFGSGPARTIPPGFDRDEARRQILQFLRMSAPLAARHGITLVVEHLNRGECNVINSVAEAMEYVKQIDHPSFQCLVDSYHFWLENESLDTLRQAMPYIRHVHLADRAGRVAPGESGRDDYRPFFRVLREGGYDGPISIEPDHFADITGAAPRVLAFVRRQWEQSC